jgi:hypothetical protein
MTEYPTWFKPEVSRKRVVRVLARGPVFDQRPQCVGERPTCPDCASCSLNTPLVPPR